MRPNDELREAIGRLLKPGYHVCTDSDPEDVLVHPDGVDSDVYYDITLGSGDWTVCEVVNGTFGQTWTRLDLIDALREAGLV